LSKYLEGADGPGAALLGPFAYTSVQLNANYAAAEHVDFNNAGPSLLVAVGAFSGGRLHWKGQPHRVREKWLLFDGREPHSVEPFDGERYSIVYFCNGAYAKALKEELSALADLGFRVRPLLDEAKHVLPSAEVRLSLDDGAVASGRVLLVRGLSLGCEATSPRTDISGFASEVHLWVTTCLSKNRVGVVSSAGNFPEGESEHSALCPGAEQLLPGVPQLIMVMHRNMADGRCRVANTCYLTAPSKAIADAATTVLTAASQGRLQVEVFKPR
jgi:hypothetical protein